MNQFPPNPHPVGQQQPNYAGPPPPPPGYSMAAGWQAPNIPMGTPPQPWQASIPQPQRPATVNGIVARISAPGGLLFGGFVVAAIALFLPWVTVSVDSPLGGNMYQADASPFTGGWIFAVLLVIAGAAWLAWPTLSGSRMSVQRLSGLSAVVGLQVVCLVIGLADYAMGVTEKGKSMADTGDELTNLHVSVGFGMLLYAAAVVAIVVGLAWAWARRANTKTWTA